MTEFEALTSSEVPDIWSICYSESWVSISLFGKYGERL